MNRLAVLIIALVAGSGCTQVCDPGEICTWLGTGDAGLADEGTHRLEAATFWSVDMAFGPDGLAYVLDWNNHRVVRISADDTLEIITGVGGELGDGPPGPALEAQWNHPTDLAWTSDGSLVMAAWHNSRIVRLGPDLQTVEFIGGTGGRGFSGDGGPATDAVLDLPCGIVVDEDDNILLADMANQRIRAIDPSGTIDTLAGNGEHGFNGDGAALDTSFASPALQRAEPAFKMDSLDGLIYVADTHNGRIRVFDPVAGTVTTVAGKGETPENSGNDVGCTTGCGYSGDGGPATDAELNVPSDVAVAPDGTIYIADSYNHCVRVVTPDGTIDTFAGTCGTAGFEGDGGLATSALLNHPFGVEVGPDGAVYIADTYNSVIRRVEPGE